MSTGDGSASFGVGPMLVAYSSFCFGMGLSCGFILLSLISAARVCRENFILDSESTYHMKWPFMPMVPLGGIFMNMLMLSSLPLRALALALSVDIACAVFYFLYSASRS